MDKHTDQDREILDVKILQKVNAIHRTAFQEKFPTQVEHILRLLTERLQHGLDKRSGVVVTDPDTWVLTAEEINLLSQSMYYINQIRRDINSV